MLDDDVAHEDDDEREHQEEGDEEHGEAEELVAEEAEDEAEDDRERSDPVLVLARPVPEQVLRSALVAGRAVVRAAVDVGLHLARETDSQHRTQLPNANN